MGSFCLSWIPALLVSLLMRIEAERFMHVLDTAHSSPVNKIILTSEKKWRYSREMDRTEEGAVSERGKGDGKMRKKIKRGGRGLIYSS